jgi:hypothetical protein
VVLVEVGVELLLRRLPARQGVLEEFLVVEAEAVVLGKTGRQEVLVETVLVER